VNQQDEQRPKVFRWIKTDCGRAKYADLSEKQGLWAKSRLIWFVLIAAVHDWPLADPDQPADS